jgi:hypothetical protein
MVARERFDRQMDALVPLQVVIAVETLRALVALEGTVGLWRRGLGVGMWWLLEHAAHVCGMATVESHR